MYHPSVSIVALLFSWLANLVVAIDLTITDDDSIRSAASTVAYGLVSYYTGNNTGDVPGNLPDPYYWWEAGAMFGALVDYWAFTGDDTYNDITKQALIHQAGDDGDFMPENQTKSEGNDDQGFWALAAMSAAENNFTNPDSDEPGWLALAQAVYNEYIERWEEAKDTCGGGLRWQIFTFNNGYNYKNSVSNGCFFNIAARLARYTGNDTYGDWATKIFEWEQSVNFINDDYNVLDGAGNGDGDNCTEVNQAQFTYNAGLFLYGAAHMYNHTNGDDTWKTRVTGLMTSISNSFFKDGVMWEPACETTDTGCNTDQQSFKGHLANWMALTTVVAPYTYDTIMPLLQTTAEAASKQCSGSSASNFGGATGTVCGFSWLQEATWDGDSGVGEQMNAMQSIMAPLVSNAVIYTADTGGSSEGNADAGASDSSKISQPRAITTADRAGAGILTTMVLAGLGGGIYFVISGS
ncbi:mannan endo-1,6-alpha-mannosidase DCW1 [Xylariaceae sp. FL0016]|nr:mannan endo-1,6-alpha-mannosidase DCW1 [Xylariaceae sp. FL0016]